MARFVLIAAFLFTFACAGAAAAAEPNMQEGLWEVTVKTEMQGVPMQVQPMRTTYCLTKKDMVPQKPERNQECKISNQKISGDTVTWTMQCKTQGSTIDSTGKVTYKGNKFDGTVSTLMSADGSRMQMAQKMNGQRIGECKK